MSIALDFDEDKKQHKYINQFIKEKTEKIHGFEKDFESYLGITKVPDNRSDLKPLNVLKSFEDGLITSEKIDNLKTIIIDLID